MTITKFNLRQFFIPILALGVVFSFSSCEKEDGRQPKPKVNNPYV